MKLDADLVAALNEVGWNADAVDAAQSAQDFRDNPPTQLTTEEMMEAAWKANGVVQSQWCDPLDRQMHIRFDCDGKHTESTLDWIDVITLRENALMELYSEKCREAIIKLTGSFVCPDFSELRKQKQRELGAMR